jgi:hypothetical protein
MQSAADSCPQDSHLGAGRVCQCAAMPPDILAWFQRCWGMPQLSLHLAGKGRRSRSWVQERTCFTTSSEQGTLQQTGSVWPTGLRFDSGCAWSGPVRWHGVR